jgi:hypothetical protein
VSLSPTERFREHLRTIVGLLEIGDAEAAASVAAELDELQASLPRALPPHELVEARRLLDHCEELERALRQRVLAAMQRLGAARRSTIYRNHGCRP